MEAEKKEIKGWGGISVNPTSTKVVCFSHFFFALVFAFNVCRIILEQQASFVSVISHSESEWYSIFFCWILDSVRNILKHFENFSQPDEPVGKPDQQVH